MSNKFTKLACLSALGLLSLTACSSSSSEIYAKPSNYDSAIISVEGNTDEIHHNILSIIYDAMHEGSVASNVLSKVLYAYSESVYGVYNPVTRKAGSTEITLKDAYEGTLAGAPAEKVANLKEFIRKHKAYWTYNDDGKHIDKDGNVVTDPNFEPSEDEMKNVESRWEDIERRICNAMFAKVKSGSYTKKNFFDEGKLLRALHEDGKKVNYDAAKKDYKKMIVPYDFEEEEVFDDTKGILKREYYQDSANATDYSAVKYTYVEDELIETIYNDLLVEQYLLDEDLAAIRNSRAREINVIKIEKYSSNTLNADRLVKHLVNAIYAYAPTGAHVETDKETIENHFDTLFKTYAKVAKGLYADIQADETAKDIVKDLNDAASDVYASDTGTLSGKTYYKNTTYGDLIEEYEKVLKNQNNYVELDHDLWTKYTDSGTRTLEEGLDQETIKIQQVESITEGWYIQSTMPSLPSTITDRLFTLSVANNKVEIGKTSDGVKQEVINKNLAELEAADRYYYDEDLSAWKLRDKPSDKENDFLCSINGAYFLKFEGQYVGEDYKNDIVFDDGSAYYIVQVKEAVKDVKLRNSQSASSYANTRGQKFLNEVIDEIAKKVGETGNYSTLSKQHWLEEMSIKYHDQKVYDYFKENYPDLFD